MFTIRLERQPIPKYLLESHATSFSLKLQHGGVTHAGSSTSNCLKKEYFFSYTNVDVLLSYVKQTNKQTTKTTIIQITFPQTNDGFTEWKEGSDEEHWRINTISPTAKERWHSHVPPRDSTVFKQRRDNFNFWSFQLRWCQRRMLQRQLMMFSQMVVSWGRTKNRSISNKRTKLQKIQLQTCFWCFPK